MLAETKLMDRVMRAKGFIEKADYLCAISIFKRQYGLSALDTKELFKTIHDDTVAKRKTKFFTDALKSNLGSDRLVKTLEALWLVAYANGKIEQSHRTIIARITNALGLTDEHSLEALKRAHRRNQLMQTELFHKPIYSSGRF